MKNIQATEFCHHFIREQVHEGDLCVDATMGNGYDTLLLSRLCGETGQVLAFDIQEMALQNTRELLLSSGAPLNYRLILDSHSHMDRYVLPESAGCIVFNFGYLPGGDHRTATCSATTIPALNQSLTLLKKEGLLSLCIYSGGDSGFKERDDILTWLWGLNPKEYLVIKSEYYNRPHNPPIPVLVIKLTGKG